MATSVVALADRDVSAQMERWLGLAPGAFHRIEAIATLDRGLREIRPDLVVYDLDLSGDSGFKGLGALAELYPGVPVLLLMGPESDSIHLAALEAGAAEVVAKSTWTRRKLRLAAAASMRRSTPDDHLQRIAGRLAEANNDLHDFANLIAHDLRAPIRTSRVLSERLVERLHHGDPEVDELGSRVLDGLAHVDSIVQSMLDYTTLRFDLPPAEPFSVLGAVESAVADVVSSMKLAPESVELSIDSDLRAFGSIRMIRRVVHHLVKNAFLHHPLPDGARVVIRAAAEGERVVLSVTDNGTGVPKDAMGKVFQPMYRLVADREGNGFGLSICRRIVSGYGGSIFIDVDNVVGTSVVVELPGSDESSSVSY